MRAGFLAALSLIAANAGLQTASAQSVEQFYHDHSQISMIVGFSPGGGYDLYARTLAYYMAKYLPGDPSIVVKNMPGAGSMVAANYLYNVSPKDGSEIGVIAPSVALEPLFGAIPTHFDGRKFTWIGSASGEAGVCFAWSASPIRTAKDLFQKQMTLGASGTSNLDFPLALNAIVGTKFKLVRGYSGTSEILLAMERGEVEGICGMEYVAVKAARPDWISDKKVRTLVQLDEKRDREMPDVPSIMEFARNADDRRVLNLVFGWTIIGRTFLAPPGVPADRKAALIKAFDETMKDPSFLKAAARQRLDISPTAAAQVDKFFADAYATPEPLVERAAKFFAPGE